MNIVTTPLLSTYLLEPNNSDGVSDVNQLTVYAIFTTDHYVVINLRQNGNVIGTKETKGTSGPNPVWNAPFLFDLPAGDITELPLVLEFIVMQVGRSMLYGQIRPNVTEKPVIWVIYNILTNLNHKLVKCYHKLSPFGF